MVRPVKDGKGSVTLALGEQKRDGPGRSQRTANVRSSRITFAMSRPIIAKAGCNAGTCHGAKEGKNGFKLSLRGYDPIYDVTRVHRGTLEPPRQRGRARRTA